MTCHPIRRIRTGIPLVIILALVLTLTGAQLELRSGTPIVQAQTSGIIEGLMASTPVLNYQGRLLDPATGNPKPNGAYLMRFSLYGVETLGTPLWTESKNVVVGGGLFTTQLGEIVPLNLTIFDGRPLWLGVTLGADPEATPRMPIAYAPYALHANHAANADTVGGQPPAAFAPTSHTHSAGDLVSGTVPNTRYSAFGDLLDEAKIGPAGDQVAAGDHLHDARYYPLADADARFINDNAGEVDNRDLLDGTLDPRKVSGVAWTAANDGAGSGLDADLLDGQPGSNYAAAAHVHWGATWTGAGTGLTLSGGTTGLSATGATNGVSGESATGNGVRGISTNAVGVTGRSSLGNGVQGDSDSGSGVQGYSKDGFGVRGESQTSFGGFFTSGTDHADLMLGGAVGRINTDPANQNSDLILSSNNDVIARLDNDSGENGFFRVKNSGGTDVFTVDETGNMLATGTVTTDKVVYSAARTHYFSVGSEDFVPWVNVSYSNSGGCGGASILAAGANAMVAAVHLPHGATVTKFEAFFYDTSTSDMTVTLYGQYLTGCGFFPLAEVISAGTAGYYSLADTSINWPVITNNTAAYHVKAYANAWDGSRLMIKGAVITYTIAEAP